MPTHALELMEAAAARYAVEQGRIESRFSPDSPMDVLVQHLVTLAMGAGVDGFDASAVYQELTSTYAYRALTPRLFDWALAFVVNGGSSLGAYPDYHRVAVNEQGLYWVPRKDIARRHVMSLGTIVSDASMQVAWQTGGRIGTIEESFIARLKAGDCFTFSGKVLELVRVRDMTAYVKKAARNKGTVPQWQGGKMPLSTELARACLVLLEQHHQTNLTTPEFEAIAHVLDVQTRWSHIPNSKELLVEHLNSKEGCHVFVYPFAGRTVHVGLASLFAYRVAKFSPATLSIAVNDYGFELLSADPIDWQTVWSGGALLNEDGLYEDILDSLNASELAQRRFREIARVSGLVFQGFPGANKSAKQLQASSGLFFQVFREHDPDNLLLNQAQQEALNQELELDRLRVVLNQLRQRPLVLQSIPYATPFAFPLMVERLRERVSTEKLSDRVARMLKEMNAYLD